MNVFETLSQSARQWPGRTAIIDSAGALDYQTLWREVEALRLQLSRLDLQPGQGVGVRARNGRAFVIAALAALGCGTVVMPIHHQMKPDELADMLARAPLAAILSDAVGPAPHGEATAPIETAGWHHSALHADGRPARTTGAGDRGRGLRALHVRHDGCG